MHDTPQELLNRAQANLYPGLLIDMNWSFCSTLLRCFSCSVMAQQRDAITSLSNRATSLYTLNPIDIPVGIYHS